MRHFRGEIGSCVCVSQQQMFTRVLKEHQTRQAVIKDENDRMRRVAVASVTKVTDGLMDAVNGGVVEVFTNQRKLEQEAKTLQSQSTRFTKQTTQWVTLIDNFNQALKELGDLENWAKTIEADMNGIAAALEYVYKQNNPPPPPVDQ
eukprot:Phypoly_transcript_21910.p1 GENE.Phypoly_transcript_21910~~Phypoly_transcript_21910.p1  ORF type:complete len:147 (+),score=32.71 Phypoly_transcript_21910:133-573(+)